MAVSATHPEIPKAYQLGPNILMQSHAEADPSTNPVSRNVIHGFVQRCRADLSAERSEAKISAGGPSLNPSSAKIERLLSERVMIGGGAACGVF